MLIKEMSRLVVHARQRTKETARTYDTDQSDVNCQLESRLKYITKNMGQHVQNSCFRAVFVKNETRSKLGSAIRCKIISNLITLQSNLLSTNYLRVVFLCSNLYSAFSNPNN